MDEGEYRLDPADVEEHRCTELVDDGFIDGACRAKRPDQVGGRTLEDRDKPRDPSLDGLLEDEVGVVEAGLWPGSWIIVDLDRQGWAVGDDSGR